MNLHNVCAIMSLKLLVSSIWASWVERLYAKSRNAYEQSSQNITRSDYFEIFIGLV